jgi:hypothetical protein
MMPHTLPMPNGRVPMLGQRQQQAEAGIQQAMHSLSLGIYARIAAETLDPDRPADAEVLRHLAKGSMIASQAYFEGIGVIEQTPKAPDATTDAQMMDSGL